ncbi:hypothetical protein FIBSPDRAFT_898871 [Athelia psychrophila]|uniref:Uncharacterized protein n=1 Tax=Athelia psychrophila TaxID=1759441 RepID=A0A166AHU8_9AGAM|nr:hypothetical protein FIBSPDRAFT_898871 [Fibularhizoctonia sp. CBS 109695]
MVGGVGLCLLTTIGLRLKDGTSGSGDGGDGRVVADDRAAEGDSVDGGVGDGDSDADIADEGAEAVGGMDYAGADLLYYLYPKLALVQYAREARSMLLGLARQLIEYWHSLVQPREPPGPTPVTRRPRSSTTRASPTGSRTGPTSPARAGAACGLGEGRARCCRLRCPAAATRTATTTATASPGPASVVERVVLGRDRVCEPSLGLRDKVDERSLLPLLPRHGGPRWQHPRPTFLAQSKPPPLPAPQRPAMDETTRKTVQNGGFRLKRHVSTEHQLSERARLADRLIEPGAHALAAPGESYRRVVPIAVGATVAAKVAPVESKEAIKRALVVSVSGWNLNVAVLVLAGDPRALEHGEGVAVEVENDDPLYPIAEPFPIHASHAAGRTCRFLGVQTLVLRSEDAQEGGVGGAGDVGSRVTLGIAKQCRAVGYCLLLHVSDTRADGYFADTLITRRHFSWRYNYKGGTGELAVTVSNSLKLGCQSSDSFGAEDEYHDREEKEKRHMRLDEAVGLYEGFNLYRGLYLGIGSMVVDRSISIDASRPCIPKLLKTNHLGTVKLAVAAKREPISRAPPAAAEGVNMPIPIVIGLRFVFRDAYNYPNPDSNKY